MCKNQLGIHLQDMKTKKKARPRVASFVQGDESYSIDLEANRPVSDVNNVEQSLNSLSKKLCSSQHVGSNVCANISSIEHANSPNRTDRRTFNVNYDFGHTSAMLSCQSFQSMPPVTDGEGFTTDATDLGCNISHVLSGPQRVSLPVSQVNVPSNKHKRGIRLL